MRTGTLIAIALSILGLAAMVIAFVSSASPYVTISQAIAKSGDNLHIAGDIVPESLLVSQGGKAVHFRLRDATGREIPVVYEGSPPANMGAATKVVAIGSCDGKRIQARKLLIKCPSKYNSAQESPDGRT